MRRMLVGIALVIVACSSGDSTATTGGTLTLKLAGGTGNDGAVLILVSGGPVSAVEAPAGFQIASNADGTGTHIMVVGALAAGTIATISVPDASNASAYVATVMQVADRTSFVLLDPVRYQVTISK